MSNAKDTQLTKKEEAALKKQAAQMTGFLELIKDTIESTDTAPILGAAEAVVASKLHCEEVTTEFDTSDAESAAATFVVDRVLGQMCRDLHFGIEYGEKSISKATTQLAGALARLNRSAGDIEIEGQVAGRVKWLTQMKSQQAFRRSLFDIVCAIYTLQTGLKWVVASEPDSSVDVTEDEAVAALLAV